MECDRGNQLTQYPVAVERDGERDCPFQLSSLFWPGIGFTCSRK